MNEAGTERARDMETAGHAFGTAAQRAVCRTVKAQARAYALRPQALDLLHPGLSAAGPDSLVALCEYLVERERCSPRRWFGFGGEVGLLNARAALLLGRTERLRLARRQEPRIRAGVCRASQANETGTT